MRCSPNGRIQPQKNPRAQMTAFIENNVEARVSSAIRATASYKD
jgi:hypothetical protein